VKSIPSLTSVQIVQQLTHTLIVLTYYTGAHVVKMKAAKLLLGEKYPAKVSRRTKFNLHLDYVLVNFSYILLREEKSETSFFISQTSKILNVSEFP